MDGYFSEKSRKIPEGHYISVSSWICLLTMFPNPGVIVLPDTKGEIITACAILKIPLLIYHRHSIGMTASVNAQKKAILTAACAYKKLFSSRSIIVPKVCSFIFLFLIILLRKIKKRRLLHLHHLLPHKNQLHQ